VIGARGRRVAVLLGLGGTLLTGPAVSQAQPAAQTAAQTAVPAPAGAASAAVDTAALAAEGRRRYTGLCARCHGLNLVTVGIGFDLRTFPQDDKARFVRSVTQGLRAMPSFANVVQPADLEAIWAYIGAVNGWGP
jgi:mono/diheme cytochrome c family protein